MNYGHRSGAKKAAGAGAGSELRYLALGDSYTIGERVAPEESWPERLVALLRNEGLAIADAQIVAHTGWTTDELLLDLERALPSGPFDLVSLLIGVNDQYRGRDLGDYKKGFHVLFDLAVGLSGGEAGRVIVLSIPDWGATPFAEGRDRARIASEIDRFNAVNREKTESRGALYVDVTTTSRRVSAPGSEGLLAPDGLHPSGRMYAEWARLVLPHAVKALGGAKHSTRKGG